MAELKSIPATSAEVPTPIARILDPIRDAIERRLLSRGDERAVTRGDLKRMGVVTDADLSKLDR